MPRRTLLLAGRSHIVIPAQAGIRAAVGAAARRLLPHGHSGKGCPGPRPGAGIQATAVGMTPELIDLRREPERALREAAAALRAGGVVLLPTDTVYGLAALTPDAEEDLFVLKGRPADRSIAVLVADRPAAESLAASVPTPLADLMDRHWPGPLTVVLPRPQMSRAQIGGDRQTVGVRCPNHPWLRVLLAEVGPLATTSANRHAQQTPTTPTRSWPPSPPTRIRRRITVAIDGGPCTGEASTVVTWQQGQLKILRPGPLDL